MPVGTAERRSRARAARSEPARPRPEPDENILEILDIRKGWTVAAAMVVDRLGWEVPEDKEGWTFAMLDAARLVEVYARRKGFMANVKSVGVDGIRWLTDAEALRFNEKRHRHGKGKIYRANRGLQNTDASQLEEADRERHDKLSRLSAQEIVAMKMASRL